MPRGDGNLGGRMATVEAEIRLHKDECARRYEASDKKFDRMFTFIKDAHENTGERIDLLSKRINDINLADAVADGEARGSGKVRGLILHGISVLVGGGIITTIIEFFQRSH